MKTTGRRTHVPRAPLQARAKPRIEYPRDGESVVSDFYTLRIVADGAQAVHVAVDQGPWLETRTVLGFWWFDWSVIEPGEHELIACAVYADGREAVSETVHCFKP